MSSASNGLPSCQTTPSRNLNFHTLASVDELASTTSPGATPPPGAAKNIGSSRLYERTRSGKFNSFLVSIVSALPAVTIPAVSVPPRTGVPTAGPAENPFADGTVAPLLVVLLEPHAASSPADEAASKPLAP